MRARTRRTFSKLVKVPLGCKLGCSGAILDDFSVVVGDTVVNVSLFELNRLLSFVCGNSILLRAIGDFSFTSSLVRLIHLHGPRSASIHFLSSAECHTWFPTTTSSSSSLNISSTVPKCDTFDLLLLTSTRKFASRRV